MQREPRISITTVAILLALICVGLLVTLYLPIGVLTNSGTATFPALLSMTQGLSVGVVRSTACVMIGYIDDLPDVRDEMERVLAENELNYTSFSVSYMGGRPPNATPDPFCNYTAETTFRLTIDVESFTDYDALATIILNTIDALATIENLPESRYILSLRFELGDGFALFERTFEDILSAREQGLAGAELIGALGGLR